MPLINTDETGSNTTEFDAPLNKDEWKKEFNAKNNCFFSKLRSEMNQNHQTTSPRSLIHRKSFFTNANHSRSASQDITTNPSTQSPVFNLGILSSGKGS